jgi:glyoxylase-like metal-dependent hydrolase (beta-lactamase superfamily II)
MKVGAIEIQPVLDGMIVSQLWSTKPIDDPAALAWQDQHPAQYRMFRPDGLLESTLGGFLVRTADRIVLVDAGAGQPFADGYTAPVIDADDDHDPIAAVFRRRGVPDHVIRQLADMFGRVQLEQGRLPASLAALSVRPDDVTDLVFTHLHFDHIGWASADGAPFFPNATIRCAAADLAYFLPRAEEEETTSQVFRAPKAPERLAPVLDRIETWDADGALMPGVDVRLAPGHTPGSSVVVISDGPQRALLLGDVIHCPLELMDDDFNLLVDHDQELANRVREAYARELEGTDVAVSAAHFPGLRFGRLLAGEGTRRWTFIND